MSASDVHLVVGAGVIGGRVARLLAERGHQVSVVSRSGSGPTGFSRSGSGPVEGSRSGSSSTGVSRSGSGPTEGSRSGSGPGEVTRVAADAADTEAMIRLATGAAVIYNCANPAYHRWPTDWPPIAAALLAAAERNGAVLVTLSNLYGYGPAPLSLGSGSYDAAHPMTEATPLAATGHKGVVRAQMWRDALAAHQGGRLRATEVRAADYLGPGAVSALGERVVQRVRRGRSVSVVGSADRPHTWSFTSDVAEMVVVAGTSPQAWGRAWHVPSNEPFTQRQVVEGLAAAAGRPAVRVSALPPALLRALGLFSPLLRELRETEYQFRDDFVMDSSAAQAAFGLAPTPWEEVLAAAIQPQMPGAQHARQG